MTTGNVVAINGNMVSVSVKGDVSMNEVGYIKVEDKRLKAEVIRVRADQAELQVFEDTKGVSVGDEVEFTAELLAVELGPGLLSTVCDGLQNPLPELAEQAGFFLQRGLYLKALDRSRKWTFTPSVAEGDTLAAGDEVGSVPEGIFRHRIMVPFGWRGSFTVTSIKAEGDYTIDETVAEVTDEDGNTRSITMVFEWPVKRAIDAYAERQRPEEPMVTKVRIIDTFLPVARGGTYCIPGPFGAGKTVLQQINRKELKLRIKI